MEKKRFIIIYISIAEVENYGSFKGFDYIYIYNSQWSHVALGRLQLISLHNYLKLMCQNHKKHKDLIWTFIYLLGNAKTSINFTRNFIKMCYNERNCTTLINNSINLIRC